MVTHKENPKGGIWLRQDCWELEASLDCIVSVIRQPKLPSKSLSQEEKEKGVWGQRKENPSA